MVRDINMKKELKFILVLTMIFLGSFSLSAYASNIITVDEMMFDEPTVFTGTNGGTFEWNADGVVTLDNYDGGSIRGDGDLVVIVKGENKIICSSGESYGLSTHLGSLDIKGNGTLTIEAKEKTTWSSAVYITVDNEDESINIEGINLIANGAFAGIEARVQDYDGDGNTKSCKLNINNAKVDLSGINAAYICGNEADIILDNTNITKPINAHIVDLYFDDRKNAKIFSKKGEAIKLLESEYDSNGNIDELNSFLSNYSIVSNVVIDNKAMPVPVLLVVIAVLIIAIILTICLKLKIVTIKKKDGYDQKL